MNYVLCTVKRGWVVLFIYLFFYFVFKFGYFVKFRWHCYQEQCQYSQICISVVYFIIIDISFTLIHTSCMLIREMFVTDLPHGRSSCISSMGASGCYLSPDFKINTLNIDFQAKMADLPDFKDSNNIIFL